MFDLHGLDWSGFEISVIRPVCGMFGLELRGVRPGPGAGLEPALPLDPVVKRQELLASTSLALLPGRRRRWLGF